MLRGRVGIIYGGSLLLHAGVALAVVTIREPKQHEATSISVRTLKPKQKRVEAPPPAPEPPVQRVAPRRAARQAPDQPTAAPPPAAAAASSAAPVADFGLAMTGGVGAGGIAVPNGLGTRAAPTRTTRTATPRALKPMAAKDDDSCLEALIKPKPISIPQPTYADRAREANIEGKVRVELTVDESGNVVAARILEGLGYGLDEAALEAAKSSRFEPATRCGKATRTTFVIGIRFTL